MRLTTKGRYAVTAMLDLSINAKKGPVTLSDISKRQAISLSYLEQLFSKLRKRDLVTSVRGPGGGYMLGRKDSDIDVAEIIDAVSESLDSTQCKGKGDCHGGEICLTHHLWEDLSAQIHKFLSNITLSDLVSKREIEQIARSQQERMKQIKANEAQDQDGIQGTSVNLERIVANSL
ncbi:MAG: Fe-S cluster assembly transcriptional regulator IscR [Gammaproteobacteria bacterium]|jgi:Rrf2 family iron-sulfur cluster assembly transcriptional regulator|nr:Fe-S cluster assembly transcriptional regulator IscR [Gammaproteobacteria bacterium]MBT6042671.1 Fe-S cluster assembly transcriptional regulator IscR [Gammaproteobacteria bacterium]